MTTTPVANAGPRRPLKSRQTGWARALATWLTARGVTPNAISVASIGFGLLGGAALAATQYAPRAWQDAALFVLAIVGVQGRLLCNLFDGMVAVEGGRKTPTGAIYNEFPDRLADSFVLIGAGYAGDVVYGPALGWCAALLAMLTAYVRVLGASVGGGTYFIGPMAKQHRMAVVTAACAVAVVVGFFADARPVISVALVIVCVGCVPTTTRRLSRVAGDLRAKAGAGA